MKRKGSEQDDGMIDEHDRQVTELRQRRHKGCEGKVRASAALGGAAGLGS